MCYTPNHVRKMNYSKRDAFVKNHGVPTIAFLQQLLDGPIGQGRSMESVAMFDVIAAPCPDSKPTPEQKSIGPRVAKLIKEWLIDIDILERNAGVVCFGIVTQELCPFEKWYGAYHPSPLGAPVPHCRPRSPALRGSPSPPCTVQKPSASPPRTPSPLLADIVF